MLSKISSVRCGSFDRSFPDTSLDADDGLYVLASNCTPHSRFDIITERTARRSSFRVHKYRLIAHRSTLVPNFWSCGSFNMATGQHPYQAICIRSVEAEDGQKNTLFGACGPNVFAVNLKDGSIMSKWSSEESKSSVSEKRSCFNKISLYSFLTTGPK